MAERYGVDKERIQASVPAKDISADLAMNKAIDFVKSSAVKPSAGKGTAKKNTASEDKNSSETKENE